ncbi:MAG: sodium:calcium antiporter, partial [Candidatus Hydrogenedentes bacterium]|nr:sodium:calcium antiporter [Candidatus Hydrogenedentota bacterium]
IFFVLGISSVIQPIPFNVSNNVDIGVVALATVLLFTFTFIGRPRHSVNRAQGVVLFVLYIVYLTFATIRG